MLEKESFLKKSSVHLFFLLVILCSVFMNITFWGTHYWSYLPWFFLVTYIAVFCAVSFIPFKVNDSAVNHWDIIIATVIAAGLCAFYYLYPIPTDIYGDHKHIMKVLETDDRNHLWMLLSPNVFTKSNGEFTIFSLVKLTAAQTKLPYLQVFYILNSLAGAIFWLYVIKTLHSLFSNSRIAFYTLLAIAGLSGFTVFYHGYAEVYSLEVTSYCVYLYYLYKAVINDKRKYVIFTLIALLIAIKINSSGFLLVPSLILLLIHKRKKKEITFNFFLKNIYVPICLIGVFAFVFIFKNLKGTQIVGLKADSVLTMFLPVVSDNTPHAKYMLFSPYHLTDMLNVILYVSIGSIFLLIYNYIRVRKKKNTLYTIFWGQTIIMFTFLFMINPILSLPRDWDLMAKLGPLLLFSAFVATKLSLANLNKKMLIVIAMISLFQLPLHIVNTNKQLLKVHLEDIGHHVFRSYWANGSYLLNISVNYDQKDTTVLIKRRVHIVNTLKPYAVQKNDSEYAFIISKLADLYFQTKNFNEASKYYIMAIKYFNNPTYYEYAAYSLYNAGNKQEAFKYINTTMSTSQNPDAMKFCIQLAMELKYYPYALSTCKLYNERFPADKTFQTLTAELESFMAQQNPVVN